MMPPPTSMPNRDLAGVQSDADRGIRYSPRTRIPGLIPLAARRFACAAVATLGLGAAACTGAPADDSADVFVYPDVQPADPDTIACPVPHDDVEGSGEDGGGDEACDVYDLAQQLCGVYLPPVTNVTTWSDEQLESEWTTRATDHMMAVLRTEPMTDPAPLDAGADAFVAWQETAEARLLEVLRFDAASWPDTPLLVQEREFETFDGYERRTIDYLVEPGFRIPAYLYVPHELATPAPGLVIWHGHNGDYGRIDVDRARENGTFNRYHEGASRLAEAGYVVLAPDIRSFGETGSADQHDHFAKMLLLHGRVALGVFLADAMKAVDVLESYEFVDAERIGTGGTSLGGQLTIYLTAADARVRVGVAAGYLGSHRGTHLSLLHCVCQYMPLMGRTMDIADAAMLAAPRPLVFVNGRRDPIFGAADAETPFERVAAAYALLDAEDATALAAHDGEHEWVPDTALEVFDRWLRPQ